MAKEAGVSLSREALLLKSLRHPGIPIIYDLEEDSSYYYLIEEYLDGESLFSLIKRQGNLTRAKVISHGIELCQIMVYLHSLQPYPILYLDLQPKNLIFCDGTLKLIDFDQAVTAAFAGRMTKRYGTAGCAAPEQFTDEPLDARTDIYAIGALLYYMGTGTFPSGEECVSEETFGEALAAVIRQCLSASREERYSDAGCLLSELQKLKSGVFKTNQISLLKFAVVSSSHGMGATHVSLGLSSYLSERGVSNLYLEAHEQGTLRAAAEYRGEKTDSFGIYHLECWDLKPKYGPSVKLEVPDYKAVILDFGTDLEAAGREENCELLLLICGGKWWEEEAANRAVRLLGGSKQLRVIYNYLFSKEKPSVVGGTCHSPCFRLPYFFDPGSRNQDSDCFFDELLAGTKAGRGIVKAEKEGRGRRRRTRWRRNWRFI